MTTPADPKTAGAVLFGALNSRAQIHVNRTARFDHLAAEAFNRGWHVDKLAHELIRGDLGNNPGGVITSRLQRFATTQPATGHSVGVPFCTPRCKDNAGWILDPEDGQPVGRCECRTTQEND
jgi:hypothetical protein